MKNITIPEGMYQLVLSADEVVVLLNLVQTGIKRSQKPGVLAADIVDKIRRLNTVVSKERALEDATQKYQDTFRNYPLPF